MSKLTKIKRIIRQELSNENIAMYYRIFQGVKSNLAEFGFECEGKRILDVGCGRKFPITLLFSSVPGVKVTGIDPILGGWFQNLDRGKDFQRQLGYYFIHKLIANRWWQQLEVISGRKLNPAGVDVRALDCSNLTKIADNTFDLIVSNAVFEHILDVPQAVTEIKRVLKKDGFIHIGIHLFTSLTGGHNREDGVPPWDHLRQKTVRIPPLNQWREVQYRQLFHQEFKVLKYKLSEKEPEAVGLLTDEIRNELRAYSRDELLRKYLVVIARNNK